MKSVAGQLKLDLAQYRELAAFAKLSSDLDKNTQATLTRGEKITEVLKQPQYQPQNVEDQVPLIYAATKGYLTKIDTPRIQTWMHGFTEFLHADHPEIPDGIRDTGALSKEHTEALGKAIETFNARF